MAAILNLETSTTVCSAALGIDGKVVALREENKGYTHAEHLTLFIESVLKDANLSPARLDAIAVSKGPGSYTGLRIGVSTAKGMCYALDKPLIAVPTLQALTLAALEKVIPNTEENVLFCPMIDARRMEVYCALYDAKLNEAAKTDAVIVDAHSFGSHLDEHTVYFFGNGSEKVRQTIKHPRARFLDGIVPSARYAATLAEAAYSKKQFADLAYFEPCYLKDFVAGRTKRASA